MKILVSFVFLLLFTVFKSFGQPDIPPPNPVPITGIEILLASGGAYGIYRLTRKGSKHKKN